MSSTATAVSEAGVTVVAAAAAAAAAAEKAPRKFPPPCWTQEETLALIEAYRDRWYALRRGYLRTADWDAVAATVTERCPGASPPKTSAQCRHKMEKLRQRYRAEKQRSLAYPTGRFFSSWFFFENMDAMENGTTVGSNQESQDNEKSGNGFRLKTFLDQNILKLKLNAKNVTKFDEDLDQKLDFKSAKNDGKLSSNYGSKVLNNGYNSYMDMGSDKEDEDENGGRFGGGYGVKNPVAEIKAKNFRGMLGGMKRGLDVDRGGSKGFDVSNGFHARMPVNEDMLPPGLRVKRFGNVDRKVESGFDDEEGGQHIGTDGNNGFWGNRNAVPRGCSRKYGGASAEGMINSRCPNGYSSYPRSGVEKTKRERDPVEDMVMSIKMLGEGFVNMEKMKMDMAREMEKMRMEMEMKRNELILESQKQIMEAFVKGLLEFKNKKAKTTVLPES